MPQRLLVWIRLSSLPKGMYTKSLLRFIGGAVGPVAKIDRNTENNSRGQFARLTVYVDLVKSLISKVKINGRTQRVQYESLPLIYFRCGRWGHARERYPFSQEQGNRKEMTEGHTSEKA